MSGVETALLGAKMVPLAMAWPLFPSGFWTVVWVAVSVGLLVALFPKWIGWAGYLLAMLCRGLLVGMGLVIGLLVVAGRPLYRRIVASGVRALLAYVRFWRAVALWKFLGLSWSIAWRNAERED
ncbi:MAG: hypothetical protein ABTS16_21200 [Candidatus Accumulibacter phosphatis]|uniref:Transmembrane protein n=1 Tax=Candidatus Accumulibacter contiguus TaxID=2954381 RepID=A0ABX1T6J3_9PROT|nr:hypothetical protein [Candidatus Accumulibacter contiguus]NMQ05269.1 hypothetical protein [Candidatus Accumulibacter contiguus]